MRAPLLSERTHVGARAKNNRRRGLAAAPSSRSLRASSAASPLVERSPRRHRTRTFVPQGLADGASHEEATERRTRSWKGASLNRELVLVVCSSCFAGLRQVEPCDTVGKAPRPG